MVLPIVGCGHAVVYFADSTISVSVGQFGALSVLGTERWGTVVDCGVEALFSRAYIVFGRGRLDQELEPQTWRGYSLGEIASETVLAAGEVAGPGWAELGAFAPYWKRSRASLRSALQRLARQVPDDRELHWRAVADGSIDLVDDSQWPTGDAAVAQDADIWPQERCAAVWPQTGGLSPGQTVTCYNVARRVDRVQYRWTGDDAAAMVWYR